MKIYLMRHGETDWNKEGKLQGSADIPLNENGIRLAQETAQALKELPFEVIYSSPLCRARKTAELMRLERQIPIFEDARLKEMSFGRYEGNSIYQAAHDAENPLYKFIREPENFKAQDGENFSDVIARAQNFIDEVLLPAQKEYSTVLITAHGAFIRCFLRCIENRPLSAFWGGIPLKNCCVTAMELQGMNIKIQEEGKIYYNS